MGGLHLAWTAGRRTECDAHVRRAGADEACRVGVISFRMGADIANGQAGAREGCLRREA